MIKIENITKRFSDYVAVNDLSLEIGAGELFGFLGPNGAGKTTTIKMITGILKPTSGTIEIDGLDIQKQPEAAKSIIGYIPDDPFLYGRLSGREYLDFVGGLYRIDKKRLREKVAELFDAFEMNGWVDKKCEEYSHGMRQKLVFCSAFLHDPKVLVVDEPVVGLDPQSTKQLKEMLKKYAASGATVFVSTHILSIAEELCNRVGIINKGKLLDVGSVGDLKARAAQSDINLETLFLKLIEAGRNS
jgi:ABC-2 type transport system ATP-binding protein